MRRTGFPLAPDQVSETVTTISSAQLPSIVNISRYWSLEAQPDAQGSAALAPATLKGRPPTDRFNRRRRLQPALASTALTGRPPTDSALRQAGTTGGAGFSLRQPGGPDGSPSDSLRCSD